MKDLYLMRHGQTLFNKLHRIQGWSDSPLTAMGIEQAQRAGEFFKNHDIQFTDAVCSTQERSVDTLELVTNLPYRRLKGLKEMYFGVFEGQSEDLNPEHPDEPSYGGFFAEHGYGGESITDVQSRMYETLTTVMENSRGNTVLAVSHGGAIYSFLLRWSDKEKMPTPGSVGNGSIFHFKYLGDSNFEFVELLNPMAQSAHSE